MCAVDSILPNHSFNSTLQHNYSRPPPIQQDFSSGERGVEGEGEEGGGGEGVRGGRGAQGVEKKDKMNK